MNILKTLSLRNKLSSFFFGVAVVTIFVFAHLLMEYFEFGLEDSAKLRLLTESEAFALAYKKDPSISLPSTYVTSFAYDELPKIMIRGQNLLEHVRLEDGDFDVVMPEDVLIDDTEYDPILILHRLRLFDGRVLYTIARYDLELAEERIDKLFDNRLNIVFYTVLSYLLLTVLALWYYNHKVSKRTSYLVNWAEGVSSQFSEQVPDFKFDEYNRVAACLHEALGKNADLVEREKKFLAHASHELRTPIAIIRANMEILEKIELPEKANTPIGRIERAGSNMQQITETLLWLSRKSDNQPVESEVSVVELLEQVIEEQRYLLQGEAVDIVTEFDGIEYRKLPVIPMMIVCANLIRNAFQYTHRGWVRISYQGDYVTIENAESDQHTKDYEVSFGFGLELTQKVCNKLGWTLAVVSRENGVMAQLTLPKAINAEEDGEVNK